VPLVPRGRPPLVRSEPSSAEGSVQSGLQPSAAMTESGHSESPSDLPPGKARHPFHPRSWALWKRPKRMIFFLLAMEAVALAIFAVVFARTMLPTGVDWIRFGLLAFGSAVHIQLTQRQEERRRNRTRTVLIDLTAVWTFPAAIILPVPLSVLLVALIRVQHWFIARRPAHNFVFSSITHGLSVTLTHLTFVALGPHNWGALTGIQPLTEFLVLILSGIVYEAVQIVYVSGILALGATSTPTVRNILGNAADNLLEAVTIGLGAVTAILLVTVPPAVLIMAVVTVVFNRLAELDQLQADARTDPKTGVFNMRGWTESAGRALSRAGRADHHLAVLMIDLDHFKWINDTFGHPAGDDVLRTVAQVLDEETRPTDVVGRFGGEEFLVLLPETDEEAAGPAAERIRGAIAELRIPTTDKRGAQTIISGRTTSIGVAVFPEHGDSLDGLLQAADAAVYEAKEGGRNQVRLTTGADREQDST
jgi:diguanylate cyclase (GGDEF)-like protein